MDTSSSNLERLVLQDSKADNYDDELVQEDDDKEEKIDWALIFSPIIQILCLSITLSPWLLMITVGI